MKNPGRVWRDRGFLWREFSADDAATIFSTPGFPSRASSFGSAARATNRKEM